MKTDTFSIKIPEGFEIDSFDKEAGTGTFKSKKPDVFSCIKTDEDVLTDNGYTLESFNKWCEGLDEFERAIRFIRLLVKSLNGNWVPDFDDENQYKYFPYFMGGSSGFRFLVYVRWDSDSAVGSRLCFKSRELAEHAGQNFTKWYKIVNV